MKVYPRVYALVMSCALCGITSSSWLHAQQQGAPNSDVPGRSAPARNGPLSATDFQPGPISSLNGTYNSDEGYGIREDIADKYKERWQLWKNEFLSTEIGRRQWIAYAQNTRFTLTITISKDRRQGAMTGKYKWSESGELIGATITLGSRIDDGYPDPIYYPVMNSLAVRGGVQIFGGNILAAAKLAHEFGHVNRASTVDGKQYQLQNELMPIYKKIFLSNGHNAKDPRLKKLAQQMGGTSLEIWEDREYWGEANAMLYLRDRIPKQRSRCAVFSKIKQSVERYAISYADRFRQIALLDPGQCNWE
jgi:hypothetical protein